MEGQGQVCKKSPRPGLDRTSDSLSSTLALLAAVSTMPVNSSKTWENVFVGDAQAAKAHREKLHADLELRFDGGNGVGPARQPKKSSEERKKGGKPRGSLVDDLVFEFDKPSSKGLGKPSATTWSTFVMKVGSVVCSCPFLSPR